MDVVAKNILSYFIKPLQGYINFSCKTCSEMYFIFTIQNVIGPILKFGGKHEKKEPILPETFPSYYVPTNDAIPRLRYKGISVNSNNIYDVIHKIQYKLGEDILLINNDALRGDLEGFVASTRGTTGK